VTTNKPFDQWGQTFGGDDVIAAAILDRLLHHTHILATRGPSYRMKDQLARLSRQEDSGNLPEKEEKDEGSAALAGGPV
jgi:hypothetical protein